MNFSRSLGKNACGKETLKSMTLYVNSPNDAHTREDDIRYCTQIASLSLFLWEKRHEETMHIYCPMMFKIPYEGKIYHTDCYWFECVSRIEAVAMKLATEIKGGMQPNHQMTAQAKEIYWEPVRTMIALLNFVKIHAQPQHWVKEFIPVLMDRIDSWYSLFRTLGAWISATPGVPTYAKRLATTYSIGFASASPLARAIADTADAEYYDYMEKNHRERGMMVLAKDMPLLRANNPHAPSHANKEFQREYRKIETGILLRGAELPTFFAHKSPMTIS